MQINDLHIKFSEHAKQRLDDRGITTKQLAELLHRKYKDIKLNRFINDNLCFQSGIGSLIFTMNNKTMNIITVLDADMKYIENAQII